jgi:hypothetical protein
MGDLSHQAGQYYAVSNCGFKRYTEKGSLMGTTDRRLERSC